ncbi:MAG: molybdopterin molybdotransferase MoeA [Ardenticatenales bacterium]|nr:molybdopterin molybdotransferase MoeA [Ardenticatenales bacterium]
MRESAYPMLEFDVALDRVLEHVPVLPGVERRFDEAQGWVLAEEICATEPLPPFPASTVDGFAVVAADGTAPRRLVGEQFAGHSIDLEITPGQAARITTGAPMPAGADAVMMVEWSHEEGGRVAFTRPVQPGDFIRPIGSDIASGEAVLLPGSRLGPTEIGLLAALGISKVQVHRRPVVGVMSTGDELVEPGVAPQSGQIRDSNRFSLIAALREAGMEPLDLGIVPDSWEALQAIIARGLARCDALLTSGGVSMGERDLVKPLLEQGGTIHFGRVNMKPGKPVTFATLEGKPFFALPGNPVSSLVSFEVLVRPALCKMSGLPAAAWQRPRFFAVLEQEVRHSPERPEFQRAHLRFAREVIYASTTGNQASSRLLSMLGANALLFLTGGRGDFAAGESVEALFLGG